MGSKINPGAFDCYAAAADDEPMFVLLARDPSAPAAIRSWAEDRLNRAAGRPTDRESLKIAEAMACAKAMEEWLPTGSETRVAQSGGRELTLFLTSALTVEGVLAEAMATAYRQGWDDAELAANAGKGGWLWFKPKPAMTKARDLLADDWVPSAKPGFSQRIAEAIAKITRLPAMRPINSYASGKRALGIIGDEIAAALNEELAAGRVSINDVRAAGGLECAHLNTRSTQTGDGTPLEFCVDCGTNQVVGRAPEPEAMQVVTVIETSGPLSAADREKLIAAANWDDPAAQFGAGRHNY